MACQASRVSSWTWFEDDLWETTKSLLSSTIVHPLRNRIDYSQLEASTPASKILLCSLNHLHSNISESRQMCLRCLQHPSIQKNKAAGLLESQHPNALVIFDTAVKKYCPLWYFLRRFKEVDTFMCFGSSSWCITQLAWTLKLMSVNSPSGIWGILQDTQVCKGAKQCHVQQWGVFFP